MGLEKSESQVIYCPSLEGLPKILPAVSFASARIKEAQNARFPPPPCRLRKTRKRPPLCGFVQVGLWEVGSCRRLQRMKGKNLPKIASHSPF